MVAAKVPEEKEEEVIEDTTASTVITKTPSILDLCPVLLHTALIDCSNEGEQPQALSTLHGLSAYVRQCLFVDPTNPNRSITSKVIQTLRDQILSNNIEQMNAVQQQQQLECITAIATNIPRPGHSVVGQKTYAGGAIVWEALAREYAMLDDPIRITTNDTYDEESDTTNSTSTTIPLSEECLLYRQYTESCELVEIELLADTSPAYLLSAGGAMARFFIM